LLHRSHARGLRQRAAQNGDGVMAGKKEDLNLGKGKGKAKGKDDEAAKGGKGKLIIIAVAALVLIGGGAGAFVFLSGGDDAEAEVAVVEELPDEPLYLDMKKLLVNLEHEGDSHYFQAEIQLMSYSKEVIEQAFRDRPAIRDRLIMLFSGQDFAALKTVEGKEALRAAALRTVNQTLELTPPNVVEEVYFENFVLQ
jgi:flagellar FliL protein